MSQKKDVIIEQLRDQLDNAQMEIADNEDCTHELEVEVLRLRSANQDCFYAGRKSTTDKSTLRAWLKYKNEVGL